MLSQNSVSSTQTATLEIWLHLILKMIDLKKLKKAFRVEIGVRVKIRLEIVIETMNFIHPENLGLWGIFLSKIQLHEKNAPLP